LFLSYVTIDLIKCNDRVQIIEQEMGHIHTIDNPCTKETCIKKNNVTSFPSTC